MMHTLLPDVVEHWADRSPEHQAITMGGAALSYKALWTRASRLAGALAERGVRRGERVVIFMDNVPDCAVALFGVWLADAVAVPVNAQTKEEKLGWILRHSEAVAMISEAHLAYAYAPVTAGSELRAVIAASTQGKDSDAAESLDAVVAGAPDRSLPRRNVPLDLALILYTSGTTGEPKGVMHTHQSLCFARDSIAAYLEVGSEDRVLCVLPLSFGYGLFQLLPATAAGATVVLERNFTYPAAVFQSMTREAVTTFAGVPTTFAMMLAHDAKKPLRFPSVRLVTNAGAALPEEFIEGILRIFPSAGLVKMYGQTECIRACYLPAELAERHPGAVGVAMPGTELLLLDDESREVAHGEAGTLHVRGTNVMRGYWKDPARTAETLVPGPGPAELMLRTGDQFRRDEHGLLHFVARQDDIIKSRGEKVSPTEVENAIYRLKAVAEAVVLGVPDPILGQAVCALVTVKSGEMLRENDVKRVCTELLETYMVPTRVLIVDAIPHTSRGKLSRKLAWEHFEAQLLGAAPHPQPIPESRS